MLKDRYNRLARRYVMAAAALLIVAALVATLGPNTAGGTDKLQRREPKEAVESAAPQGPAPSKTLNLENAKPIASVGDCTGVVGGMTGHPVALVAAAITAYGCGAFLGSWNANWICWASRQWWGGYYRWTVSVVTGGRYNRC